MPLQARVLSVLCLLPFLCRGGCNIEANVVGVRGRELVAGIPALGKARRVQWWDLQWTNETAEGVAVSDADVTDPEVAEALGSWADLDFHDRPPALTCRTDPEMQLLVCYEATDPTTPFTNHTKGCCADSLVIYPKSNRERVVLPFLPQLREALAVDGVDPQDAATAFGTHTLAISVSPSGALQVLANIHYNSTVEMSGHFVDGAVVFELTNSGGSYSVSVVPTAAGRMSFVHHRDIGTFSTTPEDGIYRLQYLQRPEVELKWNEQWHGNGVLRFRDQQGTPLFAFTQRQASQMVILTDPWAVPSFEILQRFGTPAVYDSRSQNVSWHSFGVHTDEGALWGGVHNIFHMLYADGRETMTLFCNSQGQDSESKVYEFDLKLTPQASVGQKALNDDVFATTYTRVALGFSAEAMGGARPLSPGLYIAATGLNPPFEGLEVADTHGHLLQLTYTAEPGTASFYDPFTFVKLPVAGSSSAAPAAPSGDKSTALIHTSQSSIADVLVGVAILVAGGAVFLLLGRVWLRTSATNHCSYQPLASTQPGPAGPIAQL